MSNGGKGAEMVQRLPQAHSARLVPGLSDAQRIEAAGEANAAEACLVEYIEELEKRGRAPRAGGLPARVLEALKDGPLRLTDLATKVGSAMNETGGAVVRMAHKGRVVQLARGVWALPGQTLDDFEGEAHGALSQRVLAFLASKSGPVETWKMLRHLSGEMTRGHLAVMLCRLEKAGKVKHARRGAWEIA